MDPYTKSQLNRLKIAKVNPYFNIWLVDWLGRTTWTDFDETSHFKATYPKVTGDYKKNLINLFFFPLSFSNKKNYNGLVGVALYRVFHIN